MTKMSLTDYILSDENVYLAIYAVKSFVSQIAIASCNS